jgi:hypothetical protein
MPGFFQSILLLATLFIAGPGSVQAAESAWIEDLHFLARELPKRHANAFAHLSRQAWNARVAQLEQAIPTLAANRIQSEFMMLVAALDDSHTTLQPPALLQTGVPLRLVAWPDGIRVFGIAKEHRELLGAQLVAVEGLPLAEIQQSLARVSASDNEGARHAKLPRLLTRPHLLHALGLAKDGEKVHYEFATDAGRKHELTLSSGALAHDAAYEHPARIGVTDQRGQLWHHFEFLADEGIAYVQFNRCASDPLHDLTVFTETVKAATTQVAPKVWVFDLQYNGGGNSALGDKMFATLLRRGDRVIGVIGPQTFSSGVMNGMTLKARYGATLVGRPTGGKPTHFGEVRTFALPNSQLVVQYSTKRFVHGEPGADSLAPDHLVARTHVDYVAGKDPILEKIRELVRK